jgi:hypothetical protein
MNIGIYIFFFVFETFVSRTLAKRKEEKENRISVKVEGRRREHTASDISALARRPKKKRRRREERK